MTITGELRFLDPVDPRWAWEAACRAARAPEGYRVHRERDFWIGEAGQGADAMVSMYFGVEGSRVQETPENGEPPAYVVVRFTRTLSEGNERADKDRVIIMLSVLAVTHGYVGGLAYMHDWTGSGYRELTKRLA